MLIAYIINFDFILESLKGFNFSKNRLNTSYELIRLPEQYYANSRYKKRSYPFRTYLFNIDLHNLKRALSVDALLIPHFAKKWLIQCEMRCSMPKNNNYFSVELRCNKLD